MPRYWVISPYDSTVPDTWEKIWQFDLENGIISIGWRELDDISGYSESELRDAIERTYSNECAANRAKYFNMLWNFYHSIQAGDIIIARRGTKRIAAIGTVTRAAYYSHAKNIEASGPDDFYSNHIDVRWHDAPRDVKLPRIVFGIQTIYEISGVQYRDLVGEPVESADLAIEEGAKNRTEFVLERYLEDFIVSNFPAIFGDELVLYKDPEENVVGQQYVTEVGNIDILAQEPITASFVVIELKKGRESDRVVGQILRYMGWVSENLCQGGQTVKGMIICRDADAKLSYALKMTDNITVRYYQIDFKLRDAPPGAQ